MAIKRQDKALMEFKHIMDDVVHLLRRSVNAETVYFYWVNRIRNQFVLEANSTTLPNVMFQDRIEFSQFFLDQFKDIEQVRQLKIGEEISKDSLRHYYDFVPVKYVTIIPFVNNGETISLTVIETKEKPDLSEFEETFSAYRNALINVLNTYLELTDLYDDQQQWIGYEESLEKFSPRQHKVDIMHTVLNEIQKLLPDGGTTLILRGMEAWTSVLSSVESKNGPELGLVLEEKTMAYDALDKGKPQFSIHFNKNPKRISTTEQHTEGATLAIPFLINDRRHGVILAYDSNPLVFTEALKHQLINLVRMANLNMQINLGKVPVHQDLFTSEYGSFIPELWEKTIENEIKRREVSNQVVSFGLITIENIQTLRSRYRLEDLKRIQRLLVSGLNPSNYGFNGYIGFNSDYIFTYLLFTESENEHEVWLKAIDKAFKKPVDLGDGTEAELVIKCGFTQIQSSDEDAHEVISKAKKALSGVVNISA